MIFLAMSRIAAFFLGLLPFGQFERGLVGLYPDLYPRRIAPRVDG
jgi:hypothetical protein